MKTSIWSLAVLMAAVAVAPACGSSKKSKKSSSGSVTASGGGDDREMVRIPVTLSEQSLKFAFNLASASAYNIDVDGCASGYTTSATEATASVTLYRYDQGCLAKLTTFTVGATTYVPAAGGDFTTWLAGDLATFEESGNPANIVKVLAVAQLSSPLEAMTDTIEYSFSEIYSGADELIGSGAVSDPYAITVAGQSAPSYTISQVAFVGMTATGGGQFQFTMECTAAITGTGATSNCVDVLMADITYKLIADTFGGTLDINDANGLFPAGESAVNTATDVVAVGAGGTVNGGFLTVNLTGPDQMHLNPNMILILQAADTSYLYFNVDVQALP